jgi:hypothetical protein
VLCPLENRHAARTNRLRVSQIAAALLFELGMVDIRRVGTQQANTRRGVFRVKNDGSSCVLATQR